MLKFWELAPSPNSTKVRMALRFKRIEFTAVPVEPGDRRAVVEVSGQELAPVIEDRGIVVNDSEAILQYLDANYREAPRLFPATRDARRECEAWKSTLDERIVPHWRPIFMHAIGFGPAPEAAARSGFRDAMHWLEQELGDRDSFKGLDKAICDLRVAEWATFGLPGEGLIKRVRLFEKFREVFGVPQASLPRLERFLVPWNARLA